MKKYVIPMTFTVLSLLCLAVFTIFAHSATRAASPPTQYTVLKYTEIYSGGTFIDIGVPGLTNGDYDVFVDPLLDNHGTVVGHENGRCIYTDVSTKREECRWTNVFNDGSTLTVAGTYIDGITSRLAVSGGTGAYEQVGGYLQIDPGTTDSTTHLFSYKYTFVLQYLGPDPL